MAKNENGVDGEHHPSRLSILLKGGERRFIPNCCLMCVKLNDNMKCSGGLQPPLKKGTCKRWEEKTE